ncbi:MAG: hypothetical protein VKS61_05385 [Candidatus Sericytochromatia bacterium]|nr:hypothetical protein [Candidatus Sericytochromatia bacterium]
MSVIESALKALTPLIRAEAHQAATSVTRATSRVAGQAGDAFTRVAVATARAEVPWARKIESGVKAKLEAGLRHRLENWLGQPLGKGRDWQQIAVREVTPVAGGRVSFLAGGTLRSRFPDYHALREHILVGTFNPQLGLVETLERHPMPLWLQLKQVSNEKLRTIFREQWT